MTAKGLSRSWGSPSHGPRGKPWGEVITPKYFLSTLMHLRGHGKAERTFHCGRESRVPLESGVEAPQEQAPWRRRWCELSL